MATAAQIEANRENAKLSTGPRTDEGRAASSQNASTHRLTARGLIIPTGMENDFAQLEASLRDSLRPTGHLQELVFKNVLESAWNLERARRAEAELCSSSGIDPLVDDNSQNEAKFARIRKYAKQFENSMYRAIRELGHLQTEEQFRHETHPLSDEEIADEELFRQTPHSLSEACNFQKVMSGLRATKASRKRDLQNEAKLRRQQFQDFMEEFTAPPKIQADAARLGSQAA